MPIWRRQEVYHLRESWTLGQGLHHKREKCCSSLLQLSAERTYRSQVPEQGGIVLQHGESQTERQTTSETQGVELGWSISEWTGGRSACERHFARHWIRPNHRQEGVGSDGEDDRRRGGTTRSAWQRGNVSTCKRQHHHRRSKLLSGGSSFRIFTSVCADWTKRTYRS